MTTMPHTPNKRRVEMRALRKLFVTGRLLAARAQQSDDEILNKLGQVWDQELALLHADTKPQGENHA